MSTKGYILVEGHGEVQAAHNLIVRLTAEQGFYRPWTTPRRWLNLHQWESKHSRGVKAGAEVMRPKSDIGALLILRDEDDLCPKDLAPMMASRLESLMLPFPVAYVLLHPEYEVLFLPCLDCLGFPPWDGETWESRRGIKEWLSGQLPKGRSYKPTVDQLSMTQKLDFERIRQAGVPSFGSLERALRFLAEHWGQKGLVYP